MTSQEMQKSIQEIWQLFRETDRRLQKLGEETDRRLAENFAKTEKLLAEEFAKTEKVVRETSKQVGNLDTKWGKIIENVIRRAIRDGLFKEYGIHVDKLFHRPDIPVKDGQEIEIDLLAVNRGYVIVIEVKSTLGNDDIEKHLERLSKFRLFFPEYDDRKVIGAVAGALVPDHVGRAAYQKGLFVLAQSGKTVNILNDKKFRPKEW